MIESFMGQVFRTRPGRTEGMRRSSNQIRHCDCRHGLSQRLVSPQSVLIGCTASQVEPGIYVVRLTDGAPGWIGAVGGIPAWSPDGDTVAWGNEDGLFLAALDESVRKLADAHVGGGPAWSPDGNTIAYIDRDLAQLVVIDVESGLIQFDEPVASYGARVPLRLPVVFGGPSWAPDGSRLAFVCSDGAGDEVCLVDSDGTGRKQLTFLEPLGWMRSMPMASDTPAASNAGPPVWSPDGSSLAVPAYPERSGAPKGVFIVDVERGRARRVSELLPNSVIGWFPNGRSIYFSAVQPDRSDMTLDRSDVYHVYVRARAERNLTAGLQTGARNPSLSPDGTRLALESNRAVVVLSEQSLPQHLSVVGLDATYPTWSPDSSAIAFSAEPDPIAVFN